ncbi:MAG: (d)CMP kinase [Myxococcota bacterium]
MNKKPVIAIDGPAGAGKSTLAAMVANQLGLLLVDTGALYRGVAWVSLERGVGGEDALALGRIAETIRLGFTVGTDGLPRLWIDEEDRSESIRLPEVSKRASQVSKHPQVREALLGLQRGFGERGGVVLEGRDIGTVVFPSAEIKIFLTASAQARAHRRVDDLTSRGIHVDYDQTFSELVDRDRRDTERPLAPLRPAKDALVIDTTDSPLDSVVDRVVKLVESTLGWPLK